MSGNTYESVDGGARQLRSITQLYLGMYYVLCMCANTFYLFE